MGAAGALLLLLPFGSTTASAACFDAAATVSLLRCLTLPAMAISSHDVNRQQQVCCVLPGELQCSHMQQDRKGWQKGGKGSRGGGVKGNGG